MPRVGFVLHIKPDKVDEYVAAHAEVWPEMLDAIKAAGISDYSIFLDGTRAFGSYRTDDSDASAAAMAAMDVNRRWQDAMTEFLEERVEGGRPQLLPEVFRLD